MKNLYEKFFARQLEKPAGLFGRLYMKHFLNRGNRRSNQLALKHLLVDRPATILEIGFGGGWLIREILKSTEKDTRIAGLDHSTAMVAAARRDFKPFAKRVDFRVGRAEALPFPAESFSHVCSVHTIYFWEDPTAVVKEIFRVLRPGGIVVLGLHSQAKLETQTLTQYNFKFFKPEAVVALLAAGGFGDVTLHSYDPDEWEDNHCVVARKPSPDASGVKSR